MPNILIVDDEISMLKGIEYNLQDVPGFQVYTAPDVEQATEIIEKEELDLVISDLMLPKIENGLEVMRV
ncbi:MAG: response regulator, partial [Calditrichia bacterium]|nr:response regulator [Calditrichia bacterium]